jgi:putative component of toxin-antitoxin plasmid stabilization module
MICLVAPKKRASGREKNAVPIGYERIDHHDLDMFVDWMRDRAKDRDDVKKVLAKLELLRINGIQWGRPHVRHISGTLWELKVRGKDTHRVYFRHETPAARCVWYGTNNGQEADIKNAQGIP